MKRLLAVFMFIVFLTSNAYSFDRKGFSPTAPFSVFSTFSAESPKKKQVAIDFGFEVANNPDIERTNLNISYGLTNNLEIITNLPYNLSYKNSGDDAGAEDINLGFKHRIIDETTYIPAFAYMLYIAGDIGKEEFSTEGGAGGGLILTKKIGPVKVHGNVMYFHPNREDLKETWNINLGSELSVSYNSSILFEIIGRKAIDKDKIDLLEWRLGYRVKITDCSYTTVGAGFDIKDRSPDLRLMFSISVVLPGEKQKLKRIVEDSD